MSTQCAIGLGANQGHRLDNLSQAYHALSQLLSNSKYSIVYETEALLPDGAPCSWNLPYLNMVVTGQTSLEPLDLLDKLQSIEKKLGRSVNRQKWSPRSIDCDLLYYGDRVIKSERLTVPHPELFKRFFTTIPAAQLDPHWIHPILKQSLLDAAKCFPSDSFTRTLTLTPKMLGIVNVTPDSFSDGGKFFRPEEAIKQAEKLYADGAYAIDFGAQSTKPSAKPLSWQEEWERLEPVLSGFTSKQPQVKISIDTSHFEVAKRALGYSINWINTVFYEPKFLELVEHRQLVVTATNQKSIQNVLSWAKEVINQCLAAGLKKNQILLDPGIGFSKSPLETFQILSALKTLKSLGVNTLVGHSRKPFWRICLSEPKSQADISSSILASHFEGVDYLRVHNVEMHQRALVLSQML
ncbi:MAG: dihydropteroate synthase [Chlamydiales bacterium]|nr:dihydropteroate synthase [Chlamydiales bacterium]